METATDMFPTDPSETLEPRFQKLWGSVQTTKLSSPLQVHLHLYLNIQAPAYLLQSSALCTSKQIRSTDHA